jgi:ABC-type Fe3+-siderophore transport system permease subunit
MADRRLRWGRLTVLSVLVVIVFWAIIAGSVILATGDQDVADAWGVNDELANWVVLAFIALVSGVVVGLMSSVRGCWLLVPPLVAAVLGSATYWLIVGLGAETWGPLSWFPAMALMAAGMMLGVGLAWRSSKEEESELPVPG